jgi:hypothetical protein
MSLARRTRARLGRRASDRLRSLSGAPVVVASVLAAVLVAVTLYLTVDESDGWPALVRGFAANAVGAAVIAGFAYLLFVLRFRQARLSRYLERYRVSEERRSAVSDVAYTALQHSVVDEFLSARPPRSCLLVGPPDIARSAALEELPGLLVRRGRRVPVVVDLHREGSVESLPACTRQRFITELVGAAGDDAGAARLFANLIGSGRAVAVISGLDAISEGLSKRARRTTITELLRGCLTEGLPVVATLSEDLVPPLGDIAVLRIPPASSQRVAEHLWAELRTRRLVGSRDEPDADLLARFAELAEPTRDPVLLQLAADLVAARARRGESVHAALAGLFEDPHAFRRHLAWMCEWALGCRMHEAAEAQSTLAFALRTIGVEAHFRQDLPTTFDDAATGLDDEHRRRFAAGVSELAQKDVLSISGTGGGAALHFTHAGWLAFAGALGLGTSPELWQPLLRPGAAQATFDALTMALLLDGRTGGERSFLAVLDRVADCDEARVSLDAALAVIAPLQLEPDGLAVGDAELATLEQAWRGSTDSVKLAFVRGVDFARAPRSVDFLWSQVIPPAFQRNPFHVRRAMCARIAGLGGCSWRQLGETWRELVADALERDLSRPLDAGPARDWDEYGLSVASLCWITPSLLVELDGGERGAALALLRELHEVARKGWSDGAPRARATDIGIEISLAEGFKISAARAAATGAPLEEWWWNEAREFFENAHSWISEQALLQALALADPEHEPNRRVHDVARWTKGSQSRHPFVRETAALALEDAERAHTKREQWVWRDDMQALEDGGLDLVPGAHRLLALSTLLINLSEHAFRERHDGDARIRAFTTHELPRCFRRASYTDTMQAFECDCGFRLCGADTCERVGQREFSRAFAKRAEGTARAPVLAGRRLFTRHAFAHVWKVLDATLARDRSG